MLYAEIRHRLFMLIDFNQFAKSSGIAPAMLRLCGRYELNQAGGYVLRGQITPKIGNSQHRASL
jgi:hypothetical protein